MSRLFGRPIYKSEVTPLILMALLEDVIEQQASAVFILCCDESFEYHPRFDEILMSQSMAVFGGIFPNIIVNNQIQDKGILVIPVFERVEVTVISKLSLLESSDYQPSLSITNADSFMVLVDGFTSNIDLALSQLLHQLGADSSVFGGGVGSLSLQQKPCLFTQQGVVLDAMVVIAFAQSWQLAVGHGWEVFAGPFLATKVNGNRIEQLNFQPASDIYRQVTGQLTINEEQFFSEVRSYPFGIERLDDDFLVRSPIAMLGAHLICLGSIPENTLVYILHGNAKLLIEAAVSSVDNTVAEQKLEAAVLFDCVSRYHFLQDQYSEELTGIQQYVGDDALFFGALVFGEIASGCSGSIHFYNKTAVTALLK
ncbi:FIST C-terminal domain-containing protein [Gammaproteobacteria bacterium AS21]